MGEENLIKILNGWHCDDALMKFLIDEYGIDFVISNYQQNGYYNSFYSNLSKEKIMLDAITDIKEYKDIYCLMLNNPIKIKGLRVENAILFAVSRTIKIRIDNFLKKEIGH